jgi:hypothetical protein
MTLKHSGRGLIDRYFFRPQKLFSNRHSRPFVHFQRNFSGNDSAFTQNDCFFVQQPKYP